MCVSQDADFHNCVGIHPNSFTKRANPNPNLSIIMQHSTAPDKSHGPHQACNATKNTTPRTYTPANKNGEHLFKHIGAQFEGVNIEYPKILSRSDVDN